MIQFGDHPHFTFPNTFIAKSRFDFRFIENYFYLKLNQIELWNH